MKKSLTLLFPSPLQGFTVAWKEALHFTSFKIQLLITFLFLTIQAALIAPFFNYIQTQSGYILNDFLLNLLSPADFSVSIFILIYTVLLLTAANLVTQPIHFLKCMQAYCLLIMIRMLCLYFVPLNPEPSMIPLKDPFVGKLFYQGAAITKDLFFSGHVSTMFLFFLAVPFRSLKNLFFIATILVSLFILVQHVHYTIDVAVAPIAAWLSYRLVQLIPCKM